MCCPSMARLHISVGDSNMLPQSLRFRFAIIKAFLLFFDRNRGFGAEDLPLLEFPLEALGRFSLDTKLTAKEKVVGRGSWNMPELLKRWLEILLGFAGNGDSGLDEIEIAILEKALSLVDGAIKNGPEVLFKDTDWGLKLSLLLRYCDRKKIDFSHPLARRLDVYYSDLSPNGIYNIWQRKENGEDPFSKKEMDKVLWKHRAAPRAELRKRHIMASLEAGDLYKVHEWGRFYVGDGGVVLCSDPRSGHCLSVEKDIEAMQLKKTLR